MMGFRESLAAIRRRWRFLFITLLVCIIAGIAYTRFAPKQYQATAQVFVSISGQDSGTAADLNQGNTFVQARVQSYTSVVTSPEVTSQVVSSLGLTVTPDQLASQITADAPVNTVLINIHVNDRSASEAQRITNAVARQFSVVVGELEKSNAGSSPVKLTVTQPAKLPSSPASPDLIVDLAVAILAGFVLGTAGAYIRDLSDTSFKSTDDLASSTDIPVLATIPFDKTASTGAAVSFRENPHGQRAEAFRQLRTNMQFVDVDKPPKIIAVTSALPGEGKTTTALNIAAAHAEVGQRVCLVECDLRRPSIARILGLVPGVGLTSVLVSQLELEDAIQNAGKNFAVMTSGVIPPNPSELLASDHFRKALDYIASNVDLVVLDTAPILPVADGVEVASFSEATVLVVRHGRTSRDQARRAIENLKRAGVKPVGAVLSMAPNRKANNYSYYEYSSEVADKSLEASSE